MVDSGTAKVLMEISWVYRLNELKEIIKAQEELVNSSGKKMLANDKRFTEAAMANKKAALDKYYNEAYGLEVLTGRNISTAGYNAFKANLRKKEDESAASTKKIAADQLSATREIGQHARANWKSYNEERVAGNKAVARAQKEQAKEVARVQKEQATAAANTYTSKFGRAFATLTRYFGAYQIINTVISGLRDVATDLLDVQKTMYQISAITKSSLADTNSIIDSIYRIGTSYGIAVKDVTKFAMQMAKMGKNTEEINQLADASAGLSVILGEDMVKSGRLIVTTLNQFGYSTAEASRVAGVFNQVISNSPMDIDQLTTAMQYVGSAASASGQSIEQAGIYIEELSNLGLKASKIGTGIRNVILAATKDGSDFSEKMAELSKQGITLAEAWKLFGKRGAIAGYDLIKNWDEINKKILEIPTSIQQMTQAMITSQAAASLFQKTWIHIKEIFDSIVKSDKGDPYSFLGSVPSNSNKIKEKAEQLKKANEWFMQDMNNIDLDYNKSMKMLYSDAGMSKLVYASYNKMVADARGNNLKYLKENKSEVLLRLRSDYEKEFGLLVSENNREKKLNKEKIAFQKEYQKEANAIIKETYDGKLNAEQASKKLDEETLSNYQNSLVKLGLPIKEVQKIISEAKKTTDNLINAAFSPAVMSKLNKAVRDYKSAMETIKEVVANPSAPGSGNRLSDAELLRDESTKILRKLCADGFTEACMLINPKKTEKDLLQQLRYELMALRKAVDKEISDSAVWAAKDNKDNNTKISLAGDKLFNSIMSPKELFRGNKFDKETYKKYLKYVIDNVNKSIDEAVNSSKATVSTKYLADSTAVNDAINRLSLELTGVSIYPEKNASKIALIATAINDLKINANKLKEGFDNDIKSLDNQGKSAHNKVDKKEKSLLDAVLGIDLKTIEDKKKMLEKGLGVIADIYNKFSQVILSNQMARIDSELSLEQNRVSKKEGMLSAELSNNLITQGQYNKQLTQLHKKQSEEENKIAKKKFEIQKKADIEAAIIQGLVAAAQAAIVNFEKKGTIMGLSLSAISTGIIAAETAASVAAIASRKFYPTYESGGLLGGQLVGNSHANGGIKMQLRNKSIIEAEGGEYIVNKKSTEKYKPVLDIINNDKKYSTSQFEHGGAIQHVTNNYGNGGIVDTNSININDLITALNTVEMRAYFTNKDLDAASRNKSMVEKRTSL